MGGQQGKERALGSGTGTITRSGKSKYRSGRELRAAAAGANVFTEHNGECGQGRGVGAGVRRLVWARH